MRSPWMMMGVFESEVRQPSMLCYERAAWFGLLLLCSFGSRNRTVQRCQIDHQTAMDGMVGSPVRLGGVGWRVVSTWWGHHRPPPTAPGCMNEVEYCSECLRPAWDRGPWPARKLHTWFGFVIIIGDMCRFDSLLVRTFFCCGGIELLGRELNIARRRVKGVMEFHNAKLYIIFAGKYFRHWGIAFNHFHYWLAFCIAVNSV